MTSPTRPRLLAAALLACVASSAAAQDDAVRAAAERYVSLPGMQSMMDDMLDPDAMAANMRAMLPADAPAEQVDRMATILSEEMGPVRNAMNPAMIDAAATHLTLDELDALIAFFGTPEGQSILSKQQQLYADAMQSVGPQIQAAGQSAMMRIMQEMEE